MKPSRTGRSSCSLASLALASFALAATPACFHHDFSGLYDAGDGGGSDGTSATLINWPSADCLTDNTFQSNCSDSQVCLYAATGSTTVYACRPRCDPDAIDSGCTGTQVCERDAWLPDRGTCVDRCTASDQCLPGFTCDTTRGLCACSGDTDCINAYGSDFVCGSSGQCTLGCTSDGDCLCGSHCVSSQCTAGCTTNADCCGSGTCSSGRCASATSLPLGAHCGSSDDCDPSLLCLVRFYPRGACLPPLPTACGPGACPDSRTACAFIPRTSTTSRAYCLLSCNPTAPSCPSGTACTPTSAANNTGVCLDRCASTSGCFGGSTCETTSGVCRCTTDANCQVGGRDAFHCNTSNGACTCAPACSGRNCGADGCGGTCGTCATGATCTAQGTCHSDFCGHSVMDCGTFTCPMGATCGANSTCTCPNGYRDCSGAACTGTCLTSIGTDYYCAP